MNTVEAPEQKMLTQIIRERPVGFLRAMEILDAIYEQPDVEEQVEGLLTRYKAWRETVAQRVTIHEARRHFDNGGRVLVSEYGHEPTRTVTPQTTTHSNQTTTWKELKDTVDMWRNRYPNQRYYIVEEVQNG